MSNSIISVLLPTRGRREVLKSSLESLISKAKDPERVELLLGIDEDDEGAREYIEKEIAPMLREHKVECRANIFKPLGYENLHVYVNTLAGKWCCFFLNIFKTFFLKKFQLVHKRQFFMLLMTM